MNRPSQAPDGRPDPFAARSVVRRTTGRATAPIRKRPSALAALAAMLALLLSGMAAAQEAPAPLPGAPIASGSVMERIQTLKPGEFLWAPQIAPSGPILLVISVATQRAVLYRNGVPIGVSTVSTGKPGHSTPTGVFTILQKKVDHRSNLYNDAPMPFMQRLTWSGVAIHAGHLPGYPASHGCIRLPHEFARLLFGVTRRGMTVVVTADAHLPRIAPAQVLLRNDAPAIPTTAPALSWTPEAAPEGPVSLVISAADRRVVVLRNGVPIGVAPVIPQVTVDGTTAFQLQAIDAEGYHWLRLPLPGQPGAASVTPDLFREFLVEPAFRAAVASAIAPGTTIIVTADGLMPQAPIDSVVLLEGTGDK